jgi:hypothetical protein
MLSYLHKIFILVKSGCYNHPPIASDGGVCVSQLSAKSLDLVLSSQQMSA